MTAYDSLTGEISSNTATLQLDEVEDQGKLHATVFGPGLIDIVELKIDKRINLGLINSD